MGDVQQDRLVPVFPVRSVPKTSHYDDVHPQVPVCSERFATLHLVWNSEPLQRAGDRVEKWLKCRFTCAPALERMRACRVPTSIASAGASHCHVLLDPYESPSQAHQSAAGITRSESADLARTHAVAPVPCRLL